jgi:RNA 2',3'-cyclic 3'-phosphodiesterase
LSPRRERWGDPYAGMAGRRLFVAAALPEDAAEAVRSIVDEVRAEPLPDGARDVRWVRLDGLHLTLRFLGPTAEDRVEPTAAAVRAVAAAAAGPIDLELGGAGTFPAHGRPRALWIGIVSGAEGLTRLTVDLNRALADAGWERDDRPFRAHLTLARSDGVPVGTLVADRLAGLMADRRIAARVDSIGLFESITGGGPARYVPVTSVPLGAEPDEAAGVYHQPIPGAH